MSLFYILKRAFLLLLVVFLSTFTTFVLIRLTPGDPAELILRKVFVGQLEFVASFEEIKSVKKAYDLDRSFIYLYFDWIKEILHFDFGFSYATGLKISDELSMRMAPTVSLALLSLSFSLILSVILASVYHGFKSKMSKSIIDTVIIIFIATPNFYLAILLILFFSIYLNILPVSGYGDWEYYILPVLTLGLSIFGYTTKILNSSILETSGKEYIITAKAKGIKTISVFRRHLLRNSFIPVVPYIGIQLGYMFGGIVVIETIFSFPGIGKYLVDSIQTKDIPVIQSCVLIIAFLFSITNFMADVILFILDPRIRFQNQKGIKS